MGMQEKEWRRFGRWVEGLLEDGGGGGDMGRGDGGGGGGE